jgi:hypothetical protein
MLVIENKQFWGDIKSNIISDRQYLEKIFNFIESVKKY